MRITFVVKKRMCRFFSRDHAIDSCKGLSVACERESMLHRTRAYLSERKERAKNVCAGVKILHKLKAMRAACHCIVRSCAPELGCKIFLAFSRVPATRHPTYKKGVNAGHADAPKSGTQTVQCLVPGNVEEIASAARTQPAFRHLIFVNVEDTLGLHAAIRHGQFSIRERPEVSSKHGSKVMNSIKLAAIVMFLALMATAGAAPPSDTSKDGKAEAYTKELLKLMDTDANGKVSRAEFMSFMDKEFDRLDVNKDGELDVKELTKLNYSTKHPGGVTR